MAQKVELKEEEKLKHRTKSIDFNLTITLVIELNTNSC